jgi:hypothetical protein
MTFQSSILGRLTPVANPLWQYFFRAHPPYVRPVRIDRRGQQVDNSERTRDS